MKKNNYKNIPVSQRDLKISIIKPPSNPNHRRVYPPLGLGYLAAYLKKEGLDIDFVDSTTLDFPYHLLKYDPSSYAKQAGIVDWEKIRSYFLTRARRTDIALIGGSFTADIYNTARIAEILKERNKSCITVVGGTHVSALHRETLEEFPNIDVVVMGEGEYVARELIKALATNSPLKGIKGIAYRDENNKIIVEERSQTIVDINELPFPSREMMPIEEYRFIWKETQTSSYFGFIADPAGIIISSRGCTGHCLFCASREISAGRMRLRSVENILEEIEGLIRDYRITNIGLIDDFFTTDTERTLRIAEALKKMKIKWYCYGRVDMVSEKLLRKMKDCGCVLINYGLESGDQKILDAIGKGFTLEQIDGALAMTRRAGIKYVASFTIGMPGESRETVRKTLRLAKNFGGIDAGIFRITPYPGSPLYRMALNNNWLISKEWDKYDDWVQDLKLVYLPPGWDELEFQKTFIAAHEELNEKYKYVRFLRSKKDMLRYFPPWRWLRAPFLSKKIASFNTDSSTKKNEQ